MYIKKVAYKNYRNLKSISSELDNHGNVLIAPNGSGKTNFLEAIYYSIYGNSFRPTNDYTDVIAHGKDFTSISSEWDEDDSSVIVSNNPRKRTFTLNSKRTSPRSLRRLVNIFLFAPHSVDLVNGAPSIRRDDLDTFLGDYNPKYAETLFSYKKVLKNRNALLKAIREGKASGSELQFWTNKLTDLAVIIFDERNSFFGKVPKAIAEIASNLYHDFESFAVEYNPNTVDLSENYKESLSRKFFENEHKEIIVGKTLYGPHKDDYTILLNNRDLKYLGSRGQQRLGTFLIKLAQYYIFREQVDFSGYTIFLIDDLMSELDTSHRKNIAKFLAEGTIQYILTGADPNEIPTLIKDSAKRIELPVN